MFSIIVVCLNPGDKLKETVDSILGQSFGDYEIIVKDGGSRDGSVEALPKDSHIKVTVEKDSGIYEAMNQAVALAGKKYLLFLNCGDTFYDGTILEKTARFIEENPGCGIYYGDTFSQQTKTNLPAPPKITPFVCYRNIPCHQSCFYQRELLVEKKYEPEYRIRADYEHFLWCVLNKGVNPGYLQITVSNYEGGGYSESPQNRKRDREEFKLIIRKYMTAGQRFKFGFIMALTLAPLRRFLAEKTAFSKLYNKLKAGLYR